MAAGFGAQANALLRKSAVYQKRNVCTNICLVSSPLFFCILLFIIKAAVDKILLTQDQYKCGCRCVQCCSLSSPSDCNNDPYCKGDLGYECRLHDKNDCGIQYSSAEQAEYCEIQSPSIWGPMVTLPNARNRAAPNGPALTTLITAPQSPSFTASQLSPHIYSLPLAMDNTTLLSLLSTFAPINGTIDTSLLTKYGFTFGSNSEASGSLYLDAAFLEDQLYFLVPFSSRFNCSAMPTVFPPSSGNVTSNLNAVNPRVDTVPLLQMLGAWVNFTSNTTITTDKLLKLYADSPMALSLFSKKVTCLNVLFSDQPNVAALEETLYCGYRQARCNGTSVTNEYALAYAYYTAASSAVSISLFYNNTESNRRSDIPSLMRLPVGLSGAVVSWLYNAVGGNEMLSGAARLLGNMGMPKLKSEIKLDLSTVLGPLFYTWVVQMLLPTFLQLLVYEKEKRLRMMMKMHGLGDAAYWLVTYLWYLMLYIIYMAIFIVFGAAIGLEVFRRNNIGVQIVFYFLFGNNMIAMAFMLSSLFSSARTSTVVAFLYVFATGLIGELLFKVFMENNRSWVFFVEWIPAFSLYRGLWEMASYAALAISQNSGGLNFSRLNDTGCGMGATWAILVVEWVIFMLLGWYFEQVLSSGTGIRRHPLFFLQWCRPQQHKAQELGFPGTPRASIELTNGNGGGGGGGGSSAAKGGGGGRGGGSDSLRLNPGEQEDVRAERLRVEALSSTEAASMPIVVRDLRQVFPPVDGGKPKVAVRTLTMAIEAGECFGLLGPNGAGKSTSINMLTGFLEPTSGTALIEGLDITTEMRRIYHLMGVCPQHDLLWEQLTAEEHLLFYGRLKGLQGAELANAVAAALKSVNLFNGGVGRKQAKKYSGGMKRRLSVAISFIGRPKVVYLDEPSTGLDPASRRNLWEVVRSNKDDRAIILTTHSMEEAEILCDRLGIFVDGQLVCIGNPREITSRYAGYLVFTITVGSGHEDAAQAFVAHMSPNARLTYALGGTFKYELPTTDVSLSAVFDAMGTAKRQMQVMDWGVANATLEEVFIKFARQIGAETRDQ